MTHRAEGWDGPEREIAVVPAARARRERAWYLSGNRVVAMALVLALLGLSTPYGVSSPGVDFGQTPLEWVLSAVAVIAAGGVLMEVLRRRRPVRLSQVSFILSTIVWTATAAHLLLSMPLIGVLFALGEAARCLAWAGLSLYQWRRATLRAVRGGETG